MTRPASADDRPGDVSRASDVTLRRVASALLLLGLATLAVDVGAALAPAPAATACRLALGPTCHQRPERSFALAGRPLGACARCVGLHAGGALAGLGLLLVAGRWRPRLTAPVLAAAGLLPLALDAFAGMATPSWDHAALRFATGVVAVAGLAAAACAAPGSERLRSLALVGGPRVAPPPSGTGSTHELR